jgi:hypothetical protein
MIKDIIVHLEHRIARDPARDLPSLLRRPLTRMSPELLSHTRRIFRAT